MIIGMNKTIFGMGIVAGILAIIAFFQGGFSLVSKGLLVGGQTLLGVFPLLIIAFIVAGLVSNLISNKMVSKWLGKEAGWKGPLWGSLMGALVPGGPFFFYPLMATLIVSGASVGTMISFVAAKTLWNIARIPVEIAFVGVELTAIRFLITFAFPILAGGAVNIFLPGYSEKIREQVIQLQMKNKPGESSKQND
ncbi:MAG: permease [Candidatus Contubernalis sp.]|nr:permease [Candidatus Contubernalis sp.]